MSNKMATTRRPTTIFVSLLQMPKLTSFTQRVNHALRSGESGFYCQRAAKPVSMRCMIKALILIFEPMTGWTRVVDARRGLGFIIGFYLLPMMLLVAMAEGFGLVEWGKTQFNLDQIKKFTAGETLLYEIAQTLLMFVVILVGAQLIKSLGDTFRGRNNYTQAFTVAAYGLSPVFLLRLLDAFPSVNPWLT